VKQKKKAKQKAGRGQEEDKSIGEQEAIEPPAKEQGEDGDEGRVKADLRALKESGHAQGDRSGEVRVGAMMIDLRHPESLVVKEKGKDKVGLEDRMVAGEPLFDSEVRIREELLLQLKQMVLIGEKLCVSKFFALLWDHKMSCLREELKQASGKHSQQLQKDIEETLADVPGIRC